MAGHSKWANIKHRKGAQDKRKAILFSKCSKAIMAAVRQSGPDPEMNLTLVYAIEKARAANMPRDRIERAIQAAAGGGQGQDLAQVLYEGYGPGGIAVLVESLTDNRHRTAPEIKKIFEKAGGNMGGAGCVSHLFARKSVLAVPKDRAGEDRLMEAALESGADDVRGDGDSWEVTGPPEAFSTIREGLKKAGIEPSSATVAFVPLMKVEVTDEAVARRILRLMEDLDDHDDVNNVYSNFDFPDAVMEKLAAE
jgi:YebC/PmpR family DNA-binding regulatory protein